MPVNREIYSVKIQMILSIIPFVDLWASYRIEKLRLWVLFWIGIILIGSIVTSIVVDYLSSTIVNIIINITIAVFFIFLSDSSKNKRRRTRDKTFKRLSIC